MLAGSRCHLQVRYQSAKVHQVSAYMNAGQQIRANDEKEKGVSAPKPSLKIKGFTGENQK